MIGFLYFQALQKSKRKAKKDAGPASQFSVKIKEMDNNNLEIDMIGLHFSLVNAYRRIVLSEVSTNNMSYLVKQ